jgi:hypothetical protein
MALVMLALMLVVLGMVQFALWWQAQEVVVAAAQDGVAQASTATGTPAAAEARADALLQGLQGMTTNRKVSVTPQGSDVSVTVSATLEGILPGISGLPLRATAMSHLEQAP